MNVANEPSRSRAGCQTRPVIGIPRHRLRPAAVQPLVLKEQHRIVVLVGGQQGVEGVLGRAGVKRLQPGHGQKQRLELLGVEGAEADRAAGQAQDQGAGRSRAEVHGGGIEGDLGHGLRREVGELEFLDRTVPVEGEADRITRAAALGQGRAEYARPPELRQQVFGHLERAAVGSDVLAEDDRFRALGEDFSQGAIERLGQGQILRGRGARGTGGARRGGSRLDARRPGHGRGGRGKEIRLHRRRIRMGTRHGEGNLEAGGDEGIDLGFDRGDASFSRQGRDLGAQPGHRITRQKLLEFARLQIAAGVIGGVPAQAERPGLDQHGARGRADLGDHRGQSARRSR